MKKLIAGAALLAACLVSGCGNLDLLDTNYTYDVAVVRWPDGTVREIPIRQWSDYEGEQIQIIAKDGAIYLISMNNAVLVRRAK